MKKKLYAEILEKGYAKTNRYEYMLKSGAIWKRPIKRCVVYWKKVK